jgi:uncharacterized membrane protein YadS
MTAMGIVLINYNQTLSFKHSGSYICYLVLQCCIHQPIGSEADAVAAAVTGVRVLMLLMLTLPLAQRQRKHKQQELCSALESAEVLNRRPFEK